jgi:MSHA biogenesis protein MshI
MQERALARERAIDAGQVMFESDWLYRLPWRAFRRARQASVQVGLYRSATELVAARVRLDPEAGYGVEQLQIVEIGSQRDEQVIGQLSQSGILRNAQVILILGTEHYNTYPLPAPVVPQAELREALRWKLREVLPYAAEDAVVDFIRLARAEDSNIPESLFVVAAPRRSVAQAVAPLLAAGIQVQAVDIAEMAQRNLLVQLPGAESGRALLGMDESSALLTVVNQGALCFARRIQIPRSLGAEDGDPEHVAARIATQVQRSVEVVERQSGLAPIRTVWIGPHPYCALIARCTTEQTGLECPQLDLQAELRFSASVEDPPPAAASGALVAIGAALRNEHPLVANRSAGNRAGLSWLSKLKAA